MNIYSGKDTDDALPVATRMEDVFEAQRKAGLIRRSSFDRKARIVQLDRLKTAILRREDDIVAACFADFKKPAAEVKLTEIFPVLQEISHTKRHLRSWMKSKRAMPTTRSWAACFRAGRGQ